MADTFGSLQDLFKDLGVSRAYGEPINFGGQTVVPVALVSFGLGGGSEGGSEPGQAGSGGGGGGTVIPLGVYTNNNGRTVFRPNTIATLACLVPLVAVTGAAVRRAIAAARK
jgi:uncharacterized spore protein YtfJ